MLTEKWKILIVLVAALAVATGVLLRIDDGSLDPVRADHLVDDGGEKLMARGEGGVDGGGPSIVDKLPALEQFAGPMQELNRALSSAGWQVADHSDGRSKMLRQLGAQLDLPVVSRIGENAMAADTPVVVNGGAVMVGTFPPRVIDAASRLGDGDELVRAEAVEDLDIEEDRDLVEALEPLFLDVLEDDSSEEVRALAAESLTEADDHDSLEALVNALGDTPWVADNASMAIMAMERDLIIPYLERGLNSSSEKISYESGLILENRFQFTLAEDFWERFAKPLEQ